MPKDLVANSPKDMTTSAVKMEVEKKNSHSEIEKRRRDKMNQYINDLSTMIPLPASVSRKPDKLTVLRFAVQHLKALQGSSEPLKETSHKPSFLSDDDLRNLITEASGGFLVVVECDRGQVLYVTDSVEEILHISQSSILGYDFFELVHSKDVSMIKTQLSTTVSDSKDEKNDSKISSSLKDSVESSENLCPGAKRSFFCRMKRPASTDDVESMVNKTSIRKTRANIFVDDKDPILVSYEGYLKSWPPKKEIKSSSDQNSRSCFVGIGHVVELDNEHTDYNAIGQICEFETRQRADATFVRVDHSFTRIFGYCADEVLGKSAYGFCHKDDFKIVAEAHHQALTKRPSSRSEVIHRFLAKAGHYVPVRTTSVVFRNPSTKDVDYIVSRNVVFSANDMSVCAMQRPSDDVATSTGQDDKMDENLRSLLRGLDNLDNNEAKTQRKRRVTPNKPGESTSIKNPSDIGVLIAEQAKKIGQQMKVNSQSAKYSNVAPEKEQRGPNGHQSPRNDSTVDINFRQGNREIVDNEHNRKDQNILADGILMEQLAGIESAINAMENTAGEDEEDSLSLLFNVIENEDLGGVLSDMPWNYM